MKDLIKKIQKLAAVQTAYRKDAAKRKAMLDAIIEIVGDVDVIASYHLGECYAYTKEHGFQKADDKTYLYFSNHQKWPDGATMEKAYITPARLPHILAAIERKIDSILSMYMDAADADATLTAMAAVVVDKIDRLEQAETTKR